MPFWETYSSCPNSSYTPVLSELCHGSRDHCKNCALNQSSLSDPNGPSDRQSVVSSSHSYLENHHIYSTKWFRKAIKLLSSGVQRSDSPLLTRWFIPFVAVSGFWAGIRTVWSRFLVKSRIIIISSGPAVVSRLGVVISVPHDSLASWRGKKFKQWLPKKWNRMFCEYFGFWRGLINIFIIHFQSIYHSFSFIPPQTGDLYNSKTWEEKISDPKQRRVFDLAVLFVDSAFLLEKTGKDAKSKVAKPEIKTYVHSQVVGMKIMLFWTAFERILPKQSQIDLLFV